MIMDLLGESSVRISVVAFGVAIVLRALRIRSARVAHCVWTAVAVVMMLLPALVAWGPEFAIRLLPAQSHQTVAPAGDVTAVNADRNSPNMREVSSDRSHSRTIWATVFAMMYFAGLGMFAIRLVAGVRHARAFRRGATRIHGRLTHPACITPMTIGIIAPAIVLPRDWARWSEPELAAVLAHEEEHVRHRDPLVATVMLLNRAIFWFHPLAWWLQRKVASLSEQACDAAVIARGHDRDVYSASLLQFARRSAKAGGRIVPMATAMPGPSLRTRLGILARDLPAPPSRSRVACASLACMAVVVVSAAAIPAAAPQNAPSLGRTQAAWPVVTTEHFEIVHNSLTADRVTDAVHDLESAYARLSAAFKYDVPERVRVVLVERDGDLAAQAIGDAGATTRDQRVVLSLESLDRRSDISVHELTHRFAFEIVPETSRIAPVLIEGLAEHQRGAWATQDLQRMQAAAGAQAIPTVAALVNTDRHLAHAVFDFVAAQFGDEGVRRLLFALRAHETLPQAVPMAFGLTLDQFEQDFRRYVTATFGRL